MFVLAIKDLLEEMEGDWNLDCALDNPVARVTKDEIGMGVTRGESKVPGALLRGCGGGGILSGSGFC